MEQRHPEMKAVRPRVERRSDDADDWGETERKAMFTQSFF
jgi:hypothetical protein